MILIQLPTGKTAWVDSGWWLSLSDDDITAFYNRDNGSDADPLSHGMATGGEITEDLSNQSGSDD